jgi:hypothetical protein
MDPKPDTNQSLIYKPTAKFVSKTTVSLLAKMVSSTLVLFLMHMNLRFFEMVESHIKHEQTMVITDGTSYAH